MQIEVKIICIYKIITIKLSLKNKFIFIIRIWNNSKVLIYKNVDIIIIPKKYNEISMFDNINIKCPIGITIIPIIYLQGYNPIYTYEIMYVYQM